MSVRINGLDTHYCYRDIVEVVERAGDKLDTILIPKVGTPSDVEFVATLMSQIEAAHGLQPINLHILIETALGMANVEAIAQACPDRLEAMVFGVADYAASTQARTTNIGGANPEYSVLTDADADGHARPPLGRPVALRAVAHGGGLPRLRACARSTGRTATTHDPDGLRGGRAPRRPLGLRGQVGDPPLAGRARQRRVHAQPTRRARAPAGSWLRWRRPPPRARERSRWTAA